MKILISGDYNAFNEGFNGAGVYLASGLFQSQTFERPIYFGSAEDLEARIPKQHFKSLAKSVWTDGKMKTNKPLYNAWKKHGSNAFVWFLVEACKPEDCLTLEQFWLDKERPFCDEMRGYNVAHYAEAPMKGRKMSAESVRKMIKYRTGKSLSASWRKNVSKAKGGKEVVLVKDGKTYREDTLSQFARKYGLSIGHLSELVSGKRRSVKGWTLPNSL